MFVCLQNVFGTINNGTDCGGEVTVLRRGRKERPCIRSAVSQTIVKATTEIWSRSAVGHKQQTTSLFPLPRDLHHPYVSLPNISRYVRRLWLAANVSLSANNLNNQPGWIFNTFKSRSLKETSQPQRTVMAIA